MGLPVIAHAQSVGLIQSPSSRGHAEAVTSNISGTDSLFYNPAALAWQAWSFRLVGVEAASDTDSQERVKKFVNNESDSKSFSLVDMYDKLNSTKPVAVESVARLADIAIPYFAVSSFSRLAATSESTADHYDMNVYGDVGATAGFAIKIGKLGIGYSQFRLIRARINTQPSQEQFQAIMDAAENNTLDENTVPFRDFTQFYYGGAVGQNAGLLYRLFDEKNPSAIGVSALNIGGTKFTTKAPITNKKLKELEKTMQEEAGTYDIDLELPSDIPEMYNVGVTLGWGNEESVFRALCSVEEDDVGGDYIQYKTAASCDMGFQLPDKLALASAVDVYKNDKYLYHAGLMSARVFGGRRFDVYDAYGAGLSFHFGYMKQISLVRLDLEGFQTTPLQDKFKHLALTGVRAVLGLTLIY